MLKVIEIALPVLKVIEIANRKFFLEAGETIVIINKNQIIRP